MGPGESNEREELEGTFVVVVVVVVVCTTL